MVDVSASFTGSIPEYYDTCLGPAWFDAFAADLVQRLPAGPPGDVLEIACGTGLVTRRLRGRLDQALLRQLLAESRFLEIRIEKRGVSLDKVLERVSAALAKEGGADPYSSPANAVVVEARADA